MERTQKEQEFYTDFENLQKVFADFSDKYNGIYNGSNGISGITILNFKGDWRLGISHSGELMRELQKTP